MGGGIKGFLIDLVKIGIKRLVLVRTQCHDLLSCFFKEIKFIKIVDVGLTFKKNFLSEEKYFGIIACSKVSEFPDRRWCNGKNGGSVGPWNKEIVFELEGTLSK